MGLVARLYNEALRLHDLMDLLKQIGLESLKVLLSEVVLVNKSIKVLGDKFRNGLFLLGVLCIKIIKVVLMQKLLSEHILEIPFVPLLVLGLQLPHLLLGVE